MKKIPFLLIFLMIVFCSNQSFGATFFDDFEDATFTLNNWIEGAPVTQSWIFGQGIAGTIGFNGSTSSYDPPANMVADNGQSYYMDGLSIETFLHVNSPTTNGDDRFAGVMFSLHDTGSEFQGYYASVNPNRFDQNATLNIGITNGPDLAISSIFTPSQDDPIYKLEVGIIGTQMTATLYEVNPNGDILGGGYIATTNYSGGIESGFESGLVGIFGATEVGFDNFLLEGNPVPIPGAFVLFGSGFLGLIGLRRRN